jgi:hypothetical protein
MLRRFCYCVAVVVSCYLMVACRILIVVPGHRICCLVIVLYGGVACCIVIVVPGYCIGCLGMVGISFPCPCLAWL